MDASWHDFSMVCLLQNAYHVLCSYVSVSSNGLNLRVIVAVQNGRSKRIAERTAQRQQGISGWYTPVYWHHYVCRVNLSYFRVNAVRDAHRRRRHTGAGQGGFRKLQETAKEGLDEQRRPQVNRYELLRNAYDVKRIVVRVPRADTEATRKEANCVYSQMRAITKLKLIHKNFMFRIFMRTPIGVLIHYIVHLQCTVETIPAQKLIYTTPGFTAVYYFFVYEGQFSSFHHCRVFTYINTFPYVLVYGGGQVS